MYNIKRVVIVIIVLLGITSYPGSESFADEEKEDNVTTMQIWPKGTLGDNAGLETENNMPSRGDGVIRVANVTDPSIMLFMAGQTQEKKPLVIVCPGGGYNYLTVNKEGTKIAKWFNSLGVSAAVLKYRVPNDREKAFRDIQRTIRVVRQHAQEWSVDTKRIGVMGFSAGGHLSARVSGDFANKSYEQVDDADNLSCRPDFTILIYPAYLYDSRSGLRPDIKTSSENPRTFIIQTEDDSIGVENSIYYYLALKKAGVQSALHVFPTGGHGYGMEPGEQHTVSQWPKLCEKWLIQIGIIDKKPES